MHHPLQPFLACCGAGDVHFAPTAQRLDKFCVEVGGRDGTQNLREIQGLA